MKIPTVVLDIGERAAKTFLFSFVAAVPVGSWAQGWSHVPWALAACIALGATLVSLVGNAASVPVAGNGLASLVPAVVQLLHGGGAVLAKGATQPLQPPPSVPPAAGA